MGVYEREEMMGGYFCGVKFFMDVECNGFKVVYYNEFGYFYEYIEFGEENRRRRFDIMSI